MKWTVRHMRILFDSKLSQFKTPFGTLKRQEVCTLHIMIPCSCRTTAVCLVLQAENGAELRRVPFAKQSDDTLYDTWGGELTISDAGLYFYYFHITTQDGAFRLFKQGESDTNMEDGASGSSAFWRKNSPSRTTARAQSCIRSSQTAFFRPEFVT